MNRAVYRQMDFRRYNPDLDQDNVEKILGVKTNGIQTSKLTLDTRHLPELELMEEIGYAYARKIDWSKDRQMPWDTLGGHQQPGFSDAEWAKSIFEIQNANL